MSLRVCRSVRSRDIPTPAFSIGTGLPSTLPVKSSRFRSGTGRPLLSVTVTSRSMTRTSTSSVKVGGCWAERRPVGSARRSAEKTREICRRFIVLSSALATFSSSPRFLPRAFFDEGFVKGRAALLAGGRGPARSDRGGRKAQKLEETVDLGRNRSGIAAGTRPGGEVADRAVGKG